MLERTLVTTKLVLNEAGLEWSEVDKLLLSGGSTRMPQVARMLRELSGHEPDRSMSPDEAVAHGAALYHGILQAERDGAAGTAGQSTKVVNVNAHSLSLVTRTQPPVRLYNSILIPRNTPLPHSASQVFRTGKTGQKRILIRIVEGEAPEPEACIQLGEFSIEPLPPGLPAGSPIRLQYSYDQSGRIKIRAVVDVPGPADGGPDRPSGLDDRPEDRRLGPDLLGRRRFRRGRRQPRRRQDDGLRPLRDLAWHSRRSSAPDLLRPAGPGPSRVGSGGRSSRPP